MVEEDNDNEMLEEAFRLIQEGNEASPGDPWKAADCFAQAQANLAQLASDHANDESKRNDKEQQKIAQLYEQQSMEYLKKGRKSLVQALEQDTASDGPVPIQSSAEERTTIIISKLLANLSESDATHRLQLFGRLFAKEPEDPKSVEEQESSLEQRLASLSQALPTAFKSERERVRDLNRGLARLGLEQVGDTADQQHTGRMFGFRNTNSNGDETNKSEFEQVADIIAQAKDEVAVSGVGVSNDGDLAVAAAAGDIPDATDVLLDAAADVDDDNEADDQDADFSDVDEDADLTPEICREMQTKLVAAQASLSELVALFEVDQDEDAEITFDQARGKKVLQDTRLLLRQVTKKWAES